MNEKAPNGTPLGRLIMLAEDDTDDQEFLIDALHKLDASLNIHVESSGEKAVEYLQAVSDAQLPCLIILDYNLPKVNGQQILSLLANDQRYRHVKKVVWSTSNSPLYQRACLEAGAEAYLVKPTDVTGIRQIARTMLQFCDQ